MTDREKAVLWLNSFVKNKEPMTLIPKQLIRLMHDVLKEQEEIVRCKNCKHGFRLDDTNYIVCGRPFASNRETHTEEWFCADGQEKEG